MNIHLVEPLNHFVKLQDNVWESGSWQLDEKQGKKMCGKVVRGDLTRVRPRNWLGVKFIFIKSDWNPLFMAGRSLDTGFIKRENTRVRSFSNSNIACHAEMSARVNPAGRRL
jgi:hypothetical protein